MIIQQWLDWRSINLIAPFVGIFACTYLLLSSKTCTRRKAISTALTLLIVAWLMLIWADWGSAAFRPSYQSMLFRVMILFAFGFSVFELRRVTGVNRFIAAKNKKLVADLASLRMETGRRKNKPQNNMERHYYEQKKMDFHCRAQAKRRCGKKKRRC